METKILSKLPTKEERVRTLYISSENVNNFSSSNRVSISLQETIAPEDGYNLVYGLKSIGFKSTAMNISEALKNNRIRYQFEYDGSNVTQVWDTERLQFVTAPAKLQSESYTVDYEYVIPDGHYTFDQLMTSLSVVKNYDVIYDYEPPNFVLPSGYYRDISNSHKDISNILNFLIYWKETPFGFTINLIDSDDTVEDYDEEIASTFYPILKSVTILPSSVDGFDRLYNFLFTNYNTSVPQTPISAPSQRGFNPPKGICFLVECDPSKYTLFRHRSNKFIKEIGNERFYDTSQEKYPNINMPFDMKKYIAYYKRNLDPVYIDVHISLPNASMDERGHRNILTRLFTLGTDDGNAALFQAWENPKKTILSGGQGFSTISLEFESQDNLWDFFNLEFTLEIEFSEINNEQLTEDMSNEVNLNIPVSDEISNTIQSIGRGPLRHPLSSTHFPYHSTGLHLHKKTKYT